jgi:hypothetical protein
MEKIVIAGFVKKQERLVTDALSRTIVTISNGQQYIGHFKENWFDNEWKFFDITIGKVILLDGNSFDKIELKYPTPSNSFITIDSVNKFSGV